MFMSESSWPSGMRKGEGYSLAYYYVESNTFIFCRTWRLPFVQCYHVLKNTPWMPYKYYRDRVSPGTDTTSFGLFESLRLEKENQNEKENN